MRQFGEEAGGRSGDRLSQVEEARVLRLAEVEGVMQLLEHDQFCIVRGTGFNIVRQVHQVLVKVGVLACWMIPIFRVFCMWLVVNG